MLGGGHHVGVVLQDPLDHYPVFDGNGSVAILGQQFDQPGSVLDLQTQHRPENEQELLQQGGVFNFVAIFQKFFLQLFNIEVFNKTELEIALLVDVNEAELRNK